MGGIGSGRHSYFGGKSTTEDFHSIDIRRWKRDGLLKPGRSFGWNWLRRDEVVASIRVGVATDRVILAYRHRHRGTGSGKPRYTPSTWNGRPAISAVSDPGSFVRCSAVAGV